MFVERVYREENDYTAVKIGGIATKVGDGDLFRHGIGLYAQGQEHLPQGLFSHVQGELGALVCRVPSQDLDLKERDILGAMHRTICDTYGAQPLTHDNGNGQLVIWTSSGAMHEIDLAA